MKNPPLNIMYKYDKGPDAIWNSYCLHSSQSIIWAGLDWVKESESCFHISLNWREMCWHCLKKKKKIMSTHEVFVTLSASALTWTHRVPDLKCTKWPWDNQEPKNHNWIMQEWECEPTLSPLGPRSPLGPCGLKKKKSVSVSDQTKSY